MVFLQNIWWYLVLIGVMILIHEAGHYFAARAFDVKIETFSFGFGPRLFGFKHGETDFRFSAILFGGYVKMTGEQPGDEGSQDPRSILNKPRWQRLIVAFAGPAVNLVLAVAVLAGLFMVRFPKIPLPHSPVIGYVVPTGAAAKAGVHEGDQLVQLDDVVSPNWEDVMMKEVASANQPMQIWVKRNGERLHLTVTPALDEKQGLGFAGWAQETEVSVASVAPDMAAAKAGLQTGDILISANGEPLRSTSRLHEVNQQTDGRPVQLVYSRQGQMGTATIQPTKRDVDGQERWMIGVTLEPRMEITKLAVVPAISESVRQNIQSAKLIFTFLEGIVERKMSPKSIAGPVAIAQMSGDAAREGTAPFLGLMAAVSLNLAIFNLLPIPILDGGVMLLLLVEILMGRDLDLRVKEAVVKVGFVFLMVIVVFVIYNDISKILPPG